MVKLLRRGTASLGVKQTHMILIHCVLAFTLVEPAAKINDLNTNTAGLTNIQTYQHNMHRESARNSNPSGRHPNIQPTSQSQSESKSYVLASTSFAESARPHP
ncbi:hypothetical protein BDW42DRAFT_31152 [Aspergillus taichungensis]|uniref:Uncharacterized protein n=1 Tax=Aspergillus taichungensis TaxID=482145 RepID=A0A2J5I4G2_9EURO|nr:hypothetical protein BDW42DRAFT_31152 [Aspergillus taichungensis]